MTDQLVCNINFYLYIRFLFGFYHKFQVSERVRWLARCYCCLVCTNLIIWQFLSYTKNYWMFTVALITTEYLSYVLISLRKNNKYLLQYYQKMPLIDDITNTYKPIRLCLIGYITAMFLFKVIAFIKYVILYWARGGRLFAFLEFNAWCSNIVGRSPVLFVFALLYTRVRSMRKMLESNDFECRSQGRYHPRRYIQMYEAIMDGLEESDGAVKLQLFISVLFSSAFFFLEILYGLYIMKHTVNIVDIFDVLWYILELMFGFSPLFISAILSDMVTMEVQEMLAITIERRIACNNERDRAEIQKLVQLLKCRPFEYSVWRVMPLNLRCLLSFFSFTVTTMIAIFQIKEWF